MGRPDAEEQGRGEIRKPKHPKTPKIATDVPSIASKIDVALKAK
jgi:hypothetical protein